MRAEREAVLDEHAERLLGDVARPIAERDVEPVADAAWNAATLRNWKVPGSEVKLLFVNRRHSPPNLNEWFAAQIVRACRRAHTWCRCGPAGNPPARRSSGRGRRS